MDGLINYGIVKPELAGAFGAGIRAQQDERMQNQLAQQKLAMGQMQQEQAGLQLQDFKRRQSALDQLVTKAQQSGRTGTPKEYAQQLYDYAIAAREPKLIMDAQQVLFAADEREKYAADLANRRGPAPTAAPAPAMPTGALGSGTFNIMPETTNALAPAPSVNALAPAPASVDPATAIRNRIVDLEMRYPGGAAKREIGLLETQLKELEKQQVVAPGASVFQGGKAVYTAPERQDTDLIRNFNAAKAQGFKGDLFEYQRQIAMAGRPPATPRPEAAPRTQQVTMSDGTLGIMNMDTGAITPANLGGAPVKGKPSAFAEKTAAQKAQMGKDLNFAITQLSDITKDGGLIDQSTGSGAGRLVDIGAGFVGQATKGAIAIGKIAPVADLVLKMVPRFEGPQSNKDTQSYKEAAGQLADPTLPTAIRKEAGKTVLRLMKERQGQFVSSDMAAESVAPAAAGGVVDFGSLK
jgi:hypothetical protein